MAGNKNSGNHNKRTGLKLLLQLCSRAENLARLDFSMETKTTLVTETNAYKDGLNRKAYNLIVGKKFSNWGFPHKGGMLGKKHSKETKDKLRKNGFKASLSNKGRPRTLKELAQLDKLHKTFVSKPELFIKEKFEEAGLKFIHQGTIPNFGVSSKRGHHSFDFLFTNEKVAIEFDGSYWHSKSNPNWNEEHEIKIEQRAIELGWKIIRIKEKEMCISGNKMNWILNSIPEVNYVSRAQAGS